MKEKIEQAVRTSLAKYGLKANSVTRIVNMIETNISAMGTVEADKLDGVIQTQIQGIEPLMGIFQSELDAVRTNPVSPIPTPAPQPILNPEMDELKKQVIAQQEFIANLQKEQQAKKVKEVRENLTKSLKSAMFPEGVFDKNAFDATCYELSDKFVEGADIEVLKKDALENYNNRMASSVNSQAFMPNMAIPGGTPNAETGKKYTSELVDKLLKNSKVLTKNE